MMDALTNISRITALKINAQLFFMTLRSNDMPTPRKNNPSNMPRNGSISASISWRKVDSESNTPARNAPIAIDKPLTCISNDAPSTTKSAAAVMTSRALAAANKRNKGLSNQ